MSSILLLAPFEEMAQKAKDIIRQRGLDIDVSVASNEEAVTMAGERPDKTILISRGGTANDLKLIPERTVVEINTTFSEILGELERVVFAGYTNIGIVTNDNIIDNVVQDFTFQKTCIRIRPCATHIEIRNMVKKLCQEGVQFIIGCHQAVLEAASLNVAHAYIHSGKIAIERAIDEALRIESMRGLTKFQMERLQAVIDNTREGIIIFEKKQPVFFNAIAHDILFGESKRHWYAALAAHIKSDNNDKIVQIGNTRILLKRILLKLNNNINEVFVFQKASDIENQERKIRLSSRQKGLYAKTRFSDIFICSPNMKALLHRAEKFAKTDSNVLIYGPTGSGKEGLAQSIHNASSRANYPFVSVNCASLPVDLIESELFGYVDGAFTGARKSGKPGLFEMAHKGTIFLDEIGDLPLDMQGRLLRVLQEKEVMRIGDDKIIPLDIRVICATNRNLRQFVKEEKFRQDLYYRINVLRVTLPGLRDRKEDIWPLLELYYAHFKKHDGDLSVTKKAKDILMRYTWPGNIRELKNVAEVLAFEDQVITEEMVSPLLEDDIDTVSDQGDLQDQLILPAGLSFKEYEKSILQELLSHKSQTEVCNQLGISRVTLWRKLNGVSEKK